MEVKEAYCSKEVCGLLKEKGFDIEIPTYTVKYGDIGYGSYCNWNQFSRPYSCPTHQMACAWIRKKGYSVEVHATAVGWHWEVYKVNGKPIAFGGSIHSDKTNDNDAWDDYDECMDNALMYTLTNLI